MSAVAIATPMAVAPFCWTVAYAPATPEKTAMARSSRVGSVRAMISGVALRIGLSQVSRMPVRIVLQREAALLSHDAFDE